MVSGADNCPTANSRQGIRVSPYTAFQLSGCCHQHLWAVDEVVAMPVNEGEILVMMAVEPHQSHSSRLATLLFVNRTLPAKALVSVSCFAGPQAAEAESVRCLFQFFVLPLVHICANISRWEPLISTEPKAETLP